MATRNRLKQLRAALPTIQAQEGVAEILIGDDGSTDGTREWLSARGIPFVPFPPQPYSLNPARVYNPLIESAQGEIIIFSGGEMACPDPTGVMRLAQRCDESTIALARVYNSLRIDDFPASDDWEIHNHPSEWRIWGHDDSIYSGPERPAPFMFFAALPRKIWVDLGGYDATLKRGVDGDFAQRAMSAGIRFQGVGSVVAVHLRHPKV